MKTSEPHTHTPYHLCVHREEEHRVLRRLLLDAYRTSLPGVWTHNAAKALLIEMDHATLHCNCDEPAVQHLEPYLGD